MNSTRIRVRLTWKYASAGFPSLQSLLPPRSFSVSCILIFQQANSLLSARITFSNSDKTNNVNSSACSGTISISLNKGSTELCHLIPLKSETPGKTALVIIMKTKDVVSSEVKLLFTGPRTRTLANINIAIIFKYVSPCNSQ